MGVVTDKIEEWKDLYTDKNEYLIQYTEEVEADEFYRDIFPVGSFERKGRYDDNKGNGIAVTIVKETKPTGVALEIEGNGKAKRYTITDDLKLIKQFKDTEFTIMSPISYFGNRRCGKNASYMYAMAFDLDGVEMMQIVDVLNQMYKEIIPKATYIVNSGIGLHLYYVLKEPIPMYPANQRYLKEIKYSLTRIIWNRFTSTIKTPQIQGALQGFRVVGSGTKLGKGYPVKAFQYGNKVDIEYLMGFIPDSNKERSNIEKIMMKKNLRIEEAKEKYPDWYERIIVNKERRGRWRIKRDLYDWWHGRIQNEITVGHRYFGIMTLAIYAKKCCIPEEELRKDAFNLLKPYDDMSMHESNRFTTDDIVCALEMYNEDYVTFPRDDIAKISGIKIEKNKRNGRKQAEHLKEIRIIRDIRMNYQGRKWTDKNGRPSAQIKVNNYQSQHPNSKKADCIRETGLSKPTVYKWWNSG